MTDAGAVIGILTRRNIDLVLVDDRGGHDVAAVATAADLEDRLLRVAVEFPQKLAGQRLEAAQPTVTAWEDNYPSPVDLGVSRVGPLAFHYVSARRIVLPFH